MSCERYEDLRRDERALALHLPACADCRAQLALDGELERSLGASPPPRLPAGFEARVVEAARAGSPISLSPRSRGALYAYAAAALAATAMIVARTPTPGAGFAPPVVLGLAIAAAMTIVPLVAFGLLMRPVPRLAPHSTALRDAAAGALWALLLTLETPAGAASPTAATAAAGPITLSEQRETERPTAPGQGRSAARRETAVAGERAAAAAEQVGHELARSGLAIAIGRHGAVVWEGGFGLASVEHGAPARCGVTAEASARTTDVMPRGATTWVRRTQSARAGAPPR